MNSRAPALARRAVLRERLPAQAHFTRISLHLDFGAVLRETLLKS